MANYVRRTCFLLLTMLFTLAAPLMALAEDIIILHTNDIHCGILDNVGFPHLSQYKKDLQKAGHKVLLVDAGDCLQCGLCETRCPFDVKIRENMRRAKEVFGY